MKFVLYLLQAPVVQKVDNAIHQLNHYSLDSTIGFPNALITYVLLIPKPLPALNSSAILKS